MEGKTMIVTKIFDSDCEICKHMSKHDQATFESYPELTYAQVHLDDIINHGNEPIKIRINQLVERHALNKDYTIDLPVYLAMDFKGKYIGHYQGSATIRELRDLVDTWKKPPE